MAEGGGLLNRYTPQRRIEGSNPSVSARGSFESASNQFQNQFQPPVATVNHRGLTLDRPQSRDELAGATSSRWS